MRRIASHYIYWRQFYRLHYVELNDNGVLAGIFPLEGEIAGTEFYDGFTGIAEAGSPVCVLLLGGIPLATAKFGADDSRSDGYIQRL